MDNSKRKNLHQVYYNEVNSGKPAISKGGKPVEYIDDFLSLFDSENTAVGVYKWFQTIKKPITKNGVQITKEEYIQMYCCDLSWAASYCGGTEGGSGSASTDPTNQRQQNINKIYCSLDSNKKVTLANSKTNGWTWDECKNTFNITQAEEDTAKNSCGGSSTTDGSGSSTKPAVSWTDTNATEQDVANGTLIKKLMKGDIVTKIQNHLIKHGFNNISFSKKADGKFGSRTKKAVIDFQRSKGLKDDGVVGPKTWVELIKDKSSVATTTTSGGSTTTTTPTQTGSTTPAPDNKSDTSPIVVNTDTGI
jgi:Putative peptidoglycan binding domain